MELINAILERKIGMQESLLLSSSQAKINQVLMGLDIVAHRMEMKWGIGRLFDLAPDDLKLKWSSQLAKLTAAIIAEDIPLVEELVVGCCRGWEALQRSAVALGHVPYEPMVMEVCVDGVTVPVVRHLEDQIAMPKDHAGRSVVTLEELVRAFVARHDQTFPGALKQGEYVASGKPMDESLPF